MNHSHEIQENNIMRVALIHNIVAPYRIELFKRMANEHSIEISVYYCAANHSHRLWKIDNDLTNSEILRGATIELGSIKIHINPIIILKLLRGHFHCIVIGGENHLTMQIAFILGKMLGIPVILWSEGISDPEKDILCIFKNIRHFIATNSNAIIVPGLASMKYHKQLVGAKKNIYIAPNAIDNDWYREEYLKNSNMKEGIRFDLGIRNHKIILFVGRLVKEKGLDDLIHAFEIIKKSFENVTLVIVGDGPQRHSIEKLCSDNNIEDIIMVGWQTDIDKMKYFAIADLLVLPTYKDVWGFVINEAMACGLPVIATHSAGATQDLIINGQNGFVVDAGDIQGLTISLKTILENPTLAEKMGLSSLEMIKEYNFIKAQKMFIQALSQQIKCK